MKLVDLIDDIEEFNSLVLEANSDRIRGDWEELGLPDVLCKNNPYKLLYKASEGVKIGLIGYMYISKWLGD